MAFNKNINLVEAAISKVPYTLGYIANGQFVFVGNVEKIGVPPPSPKPIIYYPLEKKGKIEGVGYVYSGNSGVLIERKGFTTDVNIPNEGFVNPTKKGVEELANASSNPLANGFVANIETLHFFLRHGGVMSAHSNETQKWFNISQGATILARIYYTHAHNAPINLVKIEIAVPDPYAWLRKYLSEVNVTAPTAWLLGFNAAAYIAQNARGKSTVMREAVQQTIVNFSFDNNA